MKIILIFLLLTPTLQTLEASSVQELEPGFCITQPNLKKYLSTTNGFNNFPTTIEFVCKYSCKKSDNSMEELRGKHKRTVYSNSQFAKEVVCDGVVVKYSPLLKNWELSEVAPIFSRTSSSDEIKLWSQGQVFEYDQIFLNQNQESFSDHLDTLIAAYKTIDQNSPAAGVLNSVRVELVNIKNTAPEKLNENNWIELTIKTNSIADVKEVKDQLLVSHLFGFKEYFRLLSYNSPQNFNFSKQ